MRVEKSIKKSALHYLLFAGVGTIWACAGGGSVSVVQQDVKVLENRLSAVQKEQAKLRGELEKLQEQLKSSQKSNADLFLKLEKTTRQVQFLQDLLDDSKSGGVNGSRKTSESNGGEGESVGKTPSGPKQVFDAAYQDFVKGQDKIAAAGFKRFLALEPNGASSDDAVFWLGEIDFSQQRYYDAIEQFKTLLVNYPEADKAPSAMLKIGNAYLAAGQKEKSADWLTRLTQRFPFSAEAALAKAKLKGLQR